MPIPQVSVYLDNRPGSLSEAMAQLDKNQIRIFALSIADAGEFGLVRMITEDPEKATKVLEDVDYNLAKSRKNTEVTAVFITDEDKISKITKILADGSINIEYAYSSAVHVDGKIALILRASAVENAEKILKANGVTVLSLAEIKKYFQ
ncbi:acetolactate synthase [Candidatus Bathyarchaeota archaeon]|nr:acetolactate synthase [Candidatus Bathyarchaeota archaeon]